MADTLVAAAGGSDLNGNSNFDRSSHGLTLPAHQLELGLWLQADMLGWMLDTLDAPPATQTTLHLIGPAPEPDAPGAAAMQVLHTVLAPADSTLHTALRPFGGQASSSLALGRSLTTWVLRATVPSASTAVGLAALLQQVQAVTANPLPAAAVEVRDPDGRLLRTSAP